RVEEVAIVSQALSQSVRSESGPAFRVLALALVDQAGAVSTQKVGSGRVQDPNTPSAGPDDPRAPKPWPKPAVIIRRPDQDDRLDALRRFARLTSRRSHLISKLKSIVACLEEHRGHPAGVVSLLNLALCSWLKYAVSAQVEDGKIEKAGLFGNLAWRTSRPRQRPHGRTSGARYPTSAFL